MDHVPEIPQSATDLIRHAETGTATDDVLAILEILLASCHPDFTMSPANASFLPQHVRELAADFVRIVLVDGLTDQQKEFIFSWAQRKMMAGPGISSA